MGERLLEPFETYGWKPDESLSEDDNMLDVLLLVTRCAKLKQGSMGCIILRPPQTDGESLLSRIVSVANNQALYEERCSNVHAEVAAIGDAARHGRPTNQCTAYITMPPCRTCFTVLHSAGIIRVVSIHQPPDLYANLGVELVRAADAKQNRARVQALVDARRKEEAERKQQSGQKRDREE